MGGEGGGGGGGEGVVHHVRVMCLRFSLPLL